MHVTVGPFRAQSSASVIISFYSTFITSRSYSCTDHNLQLEYSQSTIFFHYPFHMFPFVLVSRQEFAIQFLPPSSQASTNSESKLNQVQDELAQEGQLWSVPPAATKLLICMTHQSKLMALLQVYSEVKAAESDPKANRPLSEHVLPIIQLYSWNCPSRLTWSYVYSQSPRGSPHLDLCFRCHHLSVSRKSPPNFPLITAAIDVPVSVIS